MNELFRIKATEELTPRGRTLAMSDTLHDAKIGPDKDVLWEESHPLLKNSIHRVASTLAGQLGRFEYNPNQHPRMLPHSKTQVLGHETIDETHTVLVGTPGASLAKFVLANGDGQSRLQFVTATPTEVTLRPNGGSFLDWFTTRFENGHPFIWGEIAFLNLGKDRKIRRLVDTIDNIALEGIMVANGDSFELQARRQVMWRERPYRHNVSSEGADLRAFGSELRDRYLITHACNWLVNTTSTLNQALSPEPRTFK